MQQRYGLAAVAAALFGLGAGWFYLHAAQPHAAIVMLGNSITAGTNWNALLPTFDVANRGVPGDTAEGVLKRLDSIIAMQPQCVAVMRERGDSHRAIYACNVVCAAQHLSCRR